MSVILTLEDMSWTQGYSNTGGYFQIDITNSGNENVENIKIKVVDTSVFDLLQVLTRTGWQSCLNASTTSEIQLFDPNTRFTLPAGATYYSRFKFTVKGAAPIQVHNLTCDFQYVVY